VEKKANELWGKLIRLGLEELSGQQLLEVIERVRRLEEELRKMNKAISEILSKLTLLEKRISRT
jgi:hypothetical protein